MKKILLILLSIVSLSASAQVLKQPAGLLWYYEYKDPNVPNAPVIIFLHGSGERSNTPNLSLIQKHGLPKLLKAAGKSYLEGFTVLCPQQITSKSGWIGDPKNPDIIKFLEYVEANYPNEFRFVTGISMGGNGSWESSYKGTEKLMTGIIPVSGEGDYNSAKTTASRQIYVWAIHGSADTAVPPADGQRAVTSMINGSADPSPIWTVIPGGTHGSNTWDVAYSLTPRAELNNKTIYQWMMSKVTAPPPVTPVVKDLIDSAYTYTGDSLVYFRFRSGRLIKK